MILNTAAHRAGVFVFYDKDGKVDRYIKYLLQELCKSLDRLVIVCNGKLTPEGRCCFEELGAQVFVRENVGLDAAGYREGLVNCFGWTDLAAFDEVVLLNDTFYGPFFPFYNIFQEMATRDVDFWGLTEHYMAPGLPGLGENGRYPDHLQSYFLVIRRTMVQSLEFQRYWDEMPEYSDFNHVVGMHEVLFTQRFRNCGFVGEAYVDTSDLREDMITNINYYAFAPWQLVSERKFCGIKRKNFVLEQSELLVHSGGEELRRALDYVTQNTDYDVGMIWENLLRLYPMPMLKQTLHLNYILPNYGQTLACIARVQILLGCIHEELFSEYRALKNQIPNGISILVLTDTEEKQKQLAQLWGDDSVVFAPYMDWWNHTNSNDLVCYIQDRKMLDHLAVKTVGKSSRYILSENLLAGKDYINNIVNLFCQNPYLGILAPPIPVHSVYYGSLGCAWNGCLDEANKIGQEMRLEHVPGDGRLQPLMIDCSAWYRVSALGNSLKGKQVRDDVLGRILPLIVQDNGFYTGWVMTADFAALDVQNTRYMLEKISGILHDVIPVQRFAELTAVLGMTRDGMPIIGVKGALKIWAKKHLPKPILRFLYRITGRSVK